MNEMTATQKVAKQGWIMRLSTAIDEKLLAWICESEMGISPYGSQQIFTYSGYGWEKVLMYQSLVGAKYEEVSL
jgi:hypothetical protein